MPPGVDVRDAAFLLDVDGTLIDIAPTPDSVVVPRGLLDTLRALRRRCGDALALVTGRPIAQVDALFGDAAYAVAGEHGAVLRPAPGVPPVHADLASVPETWIVRAEALAARHPGATVERKRHGFVLHYRAVPEMAPVFELTMRAILAEQPRDFLLLPAKMAWEIRPAGIDKGRAVAALMARAPFLGRVPVFVGDDVTDEDGVAEARRLGGVGLMVGEDFADAAAVRGLAGDSRSSRIGEAKSWGRCAIPPKPPVIIRRGPIVDGGSGGNGTFPPAFFAFLPRPCHPPRMIRPLYDRILSLSASPRAPLWLAMISFAEASFFPVPPDALLIPMVLARPRRAWALAAICTVSSVLGGCLGYLIGAELFDRVARPILRIYHAEAALGNFRALYARWGLWVILIKGLTPIPYKLVTIASGAAHFNFGVFVVASAATRGTRFFLEAALLRLYGEPVRIFVEKRLTLVTMGVLVLAIAGVIVLRYI